MVNGLLLAVHRGSLAGSWDCQLRRLIDDLLVLEKLDRGV